MCIRYCTFVFLDFWIDLARLGANAIHLLGSPAEFPPRYHVSARGLSPAIVSARPRHVKNFSFWAVLPNAVSEEDMQHAGQMYMLEANLNDFGVNITGLVHDVARLETIFHSIEALRGHAQYVASRADSFRLTNYADFYNVFYLDSPSVGKLYWAIKVAFHKYASLYRVKLDGMYFIHGWFNCFRGEGNKIAPHSHGPAVSGNVALHIPKSSHTKYYVPTIDQGDWKDLAQLDGECKSGKRGYCRYLETLWVYNTSLPARKRKREPVDVKFVHNRKGHLVLFSGAVEHASSKVTAKMCESLGRNGGIGCRATAAFDIVREPLGAHHVVPLYDPEDPWWEVDENAGIGDSIGLAIERILDGNKTPAAFEWNTMPNHSEFTSRFRVAKEQAKLPLRNWVMRSMVMGWSNNRRTDSAHPEL